MSAQDKYTTVSAQHKHATVSAQHKYATVSAQHKYATVSAQHKYATVSAQQTSTNKQRKCFSSIGKYTGKTKGENEWVLWCLIMNPKQKLIQSRNNT